MPLITVPIGSFSVPCAGSEKGNAGGDPVGNRKTQQQYKKPFIFLSKCGAAVKEKNVFNK